MELSVEDGEEQTQQQLSERSSGAGAASAAFSQAASRQHRRLLGRRDTTSSGQSQRSARQNAAAPLARLEQGTRNLLLARPLDKESAEAEQASLSVLVRCRPREGGSHTKTTIPIRVVVTDANDHAPEFVGPSGAPWRPPYVLNISETTPVGSVVSREIQAIDRDAAQGPHTTIHYRVLEQADQSEPAALSSAFAFTNPLEPTLSLAAPLDYETLALTNQTTFLLTIQAQDEGEPEPLASLAQVQVNVVGKYWRSPSSLALLSRQSASSWAIYLRDLLQLHCCRHEIPHRHTLSAHSNSKPTPLRPH